MLEDAEQKKQEIEKEREELTLGGSLFWYQVKGKMVDSCPKWSVVLNNRHVSICFHQSQSLFCFEFRRNPPSDALLTTALQLVIAALTMDRVFGKENQRYLNVKHGTFWLILRKRRIQMLESAEQEKNILEKDKQDLTLAGKRTSHFIAEPVLAFVCICVHACDGWLWFEMLVNGWHSWAIFSATCWLREKRIQTMQSKEHEKDALVKEKIEMLLGDKRNFDVLVTFLQL